MRINCSVNVDDKFLSGLQHAIRLINNIESSAVDELYFPDRTFITPLFTGVFIVKLLEHKHQGKQLKLKVDDGYMNTICFDKLGVKTDCLEDLDGYFLGFRDKTYLPILNFPVKGGSEQLHDKVGTFVASFMKTYLGLDGKMYEAINYLISEAFDNIWEHSNSDRGYIACQGYPNMAYMDICIFDSGISIPGSFKLAGLMNDNDSDATALKAAIENRTSTKNKDGSVNRGFGIYTSRQMLVDGLDGGYLIYSGDSVFINGDNTETVTSLPVRLNGTVVAMRIPKYREGFDITKYYE